jgi:hypothetical protein
VGQLPINDGRVAESGLSVNRLVANLAVVLLLALSLAPGAAASSSPVPAAPSRPNSGAAAATVTPTVLEGCARDVLPKLETDMTGKNADETERLQALYEEQLGFLGVVRGG